jgi:1-deoxy-D-xylulose-5-phosphate reductoisomerase
MKLTILGATGSIGVSTLDVVARHPDRFEVVALTGHSQGGALAAQCRQFQPAYAVVGSATAAQQLAGMLRDAGVRTEVQYGADALAGVASLPEVDAVMAAIVGAAGLPPDAGCGADRQAHPAGQQGGVWSCAGARVHERGRFSWRHAVAD